MKTAKSLSTGLIVNVEDVTYEDTNNLLLVCEHCNEIVFKRCGYNVEDYARLNKNKIIIVSGYNTDSTFVHKELSLSCERKSNKVNTKDRNKNNSIARNQHFKFFKANFFKLLKIEEIQSTKTLKYLITKYNNNNLAPLLLNEEYAIKDIFCRYVLHYDDYVYVKEFIDDLIEKCKKDKNRFIEKDRDRASKWVNNLNKTIHIEICINVLEFLKTKSARPILEQLFDVLFSYSADLIEQHINFNLSLYKNKEDLTNNFYMKILNVVFNSLLVKIASCGWQEAMRDEYIKKNGEKHYV